MAKKLVGIGYESPEVVDGLRHVKCSSWSGYINFMTEKLLDYRSYVFRGHASELWKLQSTLDRLLVAAPHIKDKASARRIHLEGFKYAARGRRGPTPSPLFEENDWWALGQHHGLATPLLDWSESPYVAAYFAFCSPDEVGSEHRVIYALSRYTVEVKSEELQEYADSIGSPDPADVIEFVRPMSDDNPRLITQRGLFSRGPDGPIEDWIVGNFKGDKGGGRLIRLTIPNKERAIALKSLNRMNINHLSLFPDLYGAAKYCNLQQLVEKY